MLGIDASTDEVVDLRSGYPLGILGPDIARSWASAAGHDLDPTYTRGERTRVDSELRRAIAGCLRLPTSLDLVILPMYSGSLALNRVAHALLSRGGFTMSAAPVIDLIPGTLHEAGAGTVLITRPSSELMVDVAALCTSVVGKKPQALFIVSPVNPTGQVFTHQELAQLAAACERTGTVLVVDHCFALLSTPGAPAPMIWDVAPAFPRLRWCALWDTGKTLFAQDAKLGFIIAPRLLEPHLRGSADLVQYDIPDLFKRFFADVLGHPDVLAAHVDSVMSVVERNRSRLSHVAEHCMLPNLGARSGAFAVVQAAPLSNGARNLPPARELLESHKVSVQDGTAFLWTATGKRRYDPAARRVLRISLARPPEYFEQGLARISHWALAGRR